MIIVTLTGYLTELSCILLLVCKKYLPDVCSVVSSASTLQSTDIVCTCNGRTSIQRLKRILDRSLWYTTLYWVFNWVFCYQDTVLFYWYRT